MTSNITIQAAPIQSARFICENGFISIGGGNGESDAYRFIEQQKDRIMNEHGDTTITFTVPKETKKVYAWVYTNQDSSTRNMIQDVTDYAGKQVWVTGWSWRFGHHHHWHPFLTIHDADGNIKLVGDNVSNGDRGHYRTRWWISINKRYTE